MFSSKYCPWSFYAILAAIFLSQTFFQPTDGNDEFAKIVNTFIEEVENLNNPDSQGIHAANEGVVVTNVEKSLLHILLADCDKLHQFLVAYKHFLHSAAEKHYKTAPYIKEYDEHIKIIFEEVCFGVK
jgi:hypothetical protein